jgi:hypothetical protein
MVMRRALNCLVAALLFITSAASAIGQSITSGSVTGVVTDPSGSAIPGAAIALTNADTNVVRKTVTNGKGTYQFGFTTPGTYRLEVAAKGFETEQRSGIVVTAGQPSAGNFQLQLAAAAQQVTVTEASSAIQTENADLATDFNSKTILNLPNPGGDLTYIAQTAPGVVMNTQVGYGNFSANGMPAISNLFTVNGQNYNDLFEGINASGASNLLLGSNDIAEANVISNAYSAQYGQYAGAQISYITKSGTNQFHGNANYMWNGRALNANQFFSNQAGEPKPFNNFNQWQAGAQGPIWKDHTFFDSNYEGLRNVLPTSSALTLIPGQPFQAATLANLTATGRSDEIPFYKQIFAIYNNAPGAGAAVPVANGGCGGFSSDLLPAGAPCAVEFRSTPPNYNREYQWSGRVDHTFGPSDRGYIRVLRDNGFQPTFTSPLSPTFNIQSNQPEMSGQVSEIHTFGANAVNQLNASALFYGAIFTPSDPAGALAALPTYVRFSGDVFSDAGAYAMPGGFYYPNGRRVFQYQVLDDFSAVRGKHTLRLGITWLHDTITDLDFEGVGGPVHGTVVTTLADFFNGGGVDTSLRQAFPSALEQSMRFNTLGGYVADEWKASDRLTVSLNLRLEHYANPTCEARCFSRLASEFNGSPNPGAASVPYNQMIITGQKNAYVSTQAVVWEPRLGIAWRPFHSEKTVIRTGGGIFADQLPGGLAEGAAFNTPGFNAFTVGGLDTGTIAPGARGSLFTAAGQANQALLSGFSSGGSFRSISQTLPGFEAPSLFSFPNLFPAPRYYKWNFEIEQAVALKSVLAVNYSGMHGSHIPVADGGLNAYCPVAVCGPDGFEGLPVAPANPALGAVSQYFSAGAANYNGLTISLRRHISNSFTYSLSYTWSHALDDVSNGGISNEPFSALATNGSVTAPQNPRDIRANYGSSDYDTRHYVSANFVLADVFRQAGLRRGPTRIFGGWTLSGNWFFRSGLPFTVVDSGTYAALLGFNYQGAIFASPVARVPASCGAAVDSPCLNTSQFVSSAEASGFGTIGRNTVYGPHFFDVDLALMKSVALGEHVTFSFGAQAYNVFNHPNFDQPEGDIASSVFGSAVATVGPPTSLLGAFNGAGSSPRFVAIRGMLRF